MAISATIAGLANAGLLLAPTIEAAISARFITGVALAGVYPPAVKLIATWFRDRRGLALGAVIAALTFGSSMPHLLRVLAGPLDWRVALELSRAGARPPHRRVCHDRTAPPPRGRKDRRWIALSLPPARR